MCSATVIAAHNMHTEQHLGSIASDANDIQQTPHCVVAALCDVICCTAAVRAHGTHPQYEEVRRGCIVKAVQRQKGQRTWRDKQCPGCSGLTKARHGLLLVQGQHLAVTLLECYAVSSNKAIARRSGLLLQDTDQYQCRSRLMRRLHRFICSCRALGALL